MDVIKEDLFEKYPIKRFKEDLFEKYPVKQFKQDLFEKYPVKRLKEDFSKMDISKDDNMICAYICIYHDNDIEICKIYDCYGFKNKNYIKNTYLN